MPVTTGDRSSGRTFPDAPGGQDWQDRVSSMDQAVLDQPPPTELLLGIPGFRYSDLHDAARLPDLTRAFEDFLRLADAALFERYQAHRSAPLHGPAESELLLEVGARLSHFVGKLFGVEKELSRLRESAGRDAPIFRVKRDFVQRRGVQKGAKELPEAGGFGPPHRHGRPLPGAAGESRHAAPPPR